MPGHLLQCPQCGAPLDVARFARQATCKFCGAKVAVDPSVVSAAKYRAAYREWTTPDRARYPEIWTLAGRSWAPRARLATGDRFSIYLVDEARSPSRRAVLRVAKGAGDAAAIARTWTQIASLRGRDDWTAFPLASVLPQPVARGVIEGGRHDGAPAVLSTFRSTFRHSLVDVRRAFPAGVDPRIAMWAWRRILDAVSHLHRAGFVHGAIVPAHVLLEENDHGALLVGWSRMTPIGEERPALPSGHDAFELGLPFAASPELDIAVSARAIGHALGGDGSGQVPASVPRPFADVLARAAAGKLSPAEADAQKLYDSLRSVAHASFGPPSFQPLRMPV